MNISKLLELADPPAQPPNVLDNYNIELVNSQGKELAQALMP